VCCETTQLRCFPGAVEALKRDEQAARHTASLPQQMDAVAEPGILKQQVRNALKEC